MKIDKGVPVPNTYKSRIAVLESMEDGDSIIVDSVKEANLYYVAGRRKGIKVTRRKDGEQTRVWRTS